MLELSNELCGKELGLIFYCILREKWYDYNMKQQKLPKNFKPLLWSYRFSDIDTEKNKKTIIVNTINYGNWEQWKWIIKNYGRRYIKQFLINSPKSEFFPRPLDLISLLLGIKKFKYASRNDYIQVKMGEKEIEWVGIDSLDRANRRSPWA